MSIQLFAPLKRVISLAIFLLTPALIPLFADTQIIPQVADGSGWSTTIVLANKTASTQSVALSFNKDTANGATSPWTLTFVETVSQSSISLPAGSTLFLHTRGTSADLTQGWGQIDAAAGVVGYAIFTARTQGVPDQDATAPAVSAATRVLVPFDNTSGFVSAVAVANPTSAIETVQVTIRTSDGGTATATLANLPAKGQTTFLMATQFPGTAGKSGLAELYVSSGSISVIALRANPSGSFTSAPVYLQTGNPIIGSPNITQTSSPQTQVIPQVADGSGWSTTIVLTNTTTGDLPVTLNFNMAQTGGTTVAWTPPLQDSVTLSNFVVPAGSSRFLRTTGTAGALSQGWAALVADPHVVGYAIFTARSPGTPAQDSTAPAVSASNRILVPFDNSSGLVTALALVDPTASAESVSVNIRTSDGTTTTPTSPALPAQGQITFLMPTQFPDTAGKSGLAEFYVSSGTISIIALRANPSGAITSAPVYFETGAPIVTTGGGSTGGGGGTTGGGGGTTGGSGTGLNTLPTQAEIDSWIARGSYVGGAIAMGTSNISLTVDSIGATGAVVPTTTLTRGDAINARFTRFSGADLGKSLRGELPPGYPNLNPALGSCVVYDLTAVTTPYPNLTTLGLDAGPQITTNGPNGTLQAPRQSVAGLGFGYSVSNIKAPLNAFLAPGAYTVTGPGGADVGAFTGNGLNIANDFVLSNPADDFKLINRANGFTVRWTGGEPSTTVLISGGSSTVNSQGAVVSGFGFICLQNASAGSFTVPASILTQIPASSTTSFSGFTFVIRGAFAVINTGKGVRYDAPQGVDILTGINTWSWTYTPQYQ